MNKVVLLTRLGLTVFRNKVNYHVCTKGLPVSIDTEPYMDHVLMMFEKFTLPCMVNQTDKNFKWLILTDSAITPKYLAKLESYKSIVPNIEIIFGDYTVLDRDVSLRRDFAPHVPTSGKCITARLDADDLVSPNWIAWIRACADKWDHGAVYSRRVAKLYYGQDDTIGVTQIINTDARPLSQLALIEPDASKFVGVQCVNHADIGYIAPLLGIPALCAGRIRGGYTVSVVPETPLKTTDKFNDVMLGQFGLDISSNKILECTNWVDDINTAKIFYRRINRRRPLGFRIKKDEVK